MMDKGQNSGRRWTEDDTVLAMWLYFQLPFGKLHSGNPEIIEMSAMLGRSPSSIAMKLCNFASLDPAITKSRRTGLSSTSALDRSVYGQFGADWTSLVTRAHDTLDKRDYPETAHPAPRLHEKSSDFFGQYDGVETSRPAMAQRRIGQDFFRRAILANYENRCCITGIAEPNLLIASHIKPWSIDEKNRHNPANGLLLSATFDKAFDNGLLTIEAGNRVRISRKIIEHSSADTRDYFRQYQGSELRSASRIEPDPDFLEWHRDVCFESKTLAAENWLSNS